MTFLVIFFLIFQYSSQSGVTDANTKYCGASNTIDSQYSSYYNSIKEQIN